MSVPELLNGPVFSVILILLAGVALRHALWLVREPAGRGDGRQLREYQTRIRELQDALAQAFAERTTTLTQLQGMGSESTGAPDELDRAERQGRALTEEHTSLQAQRDEAVGKIAELLADNKQRHVQLAEAEDMVRSQQEQLAACVDRQQILETERDELARGLQRERELRQRAEGELEATSRRLADLERTAQELQAKSAAYDLVHGELAESRRTVAALSSERDHIDTLLARADRKAEEYKRAVERLEGEAASQDACLRKMRVETEEALTRLERERNERQALAQRLQIQAETVDKLRNDSQYLETLLEQQAAVQSSLLHHAERLRSANADSAELIPAQPAENAPRILSLASAEASNARQGDRTRQDPILGTIYIRPPKQADDLQRISGIGEILEKKLNRLGVYRYEQIMNWTREAIAEFSRLLSFEDRIDREQWVAQAHRLHTETTTRVA
jgi:predicted flap endonuclease-1-like 5' DNA nuclease